MERGICSTAEESLPHCRIEKYKNLLFGNYCFIVTGQYLFESSIILKLGCVDLG